MNGCRSIVGAFYIDRKANRAAALNSLSSAMQRSSQLATTLVEDVAGNQDVAESITKDGLMAMALKTKEKSQGTAAVVEMAALMQDPVKLNLHQQREGTPNLEWVRNISIFIVSRYLFRGSVPTYSSE